MNLKQNKNNTKGCFKLKLTTWEQTWPKFLYIFYVFGCWPFLYCEQKNMCVLKQFFVITVLSRHCALTLTCWNFVFSCESNSRQPFLYFPKNIFHLDCVETVYLPKFFLFWTNNTFKSLCFWKKIALVMSVNENKPGLIYFLMLFILNCSFMDHLGLKYSYANVSDILMHWSKERATDCGLGSILPTFYEQLLRAQIPKDTDDLNCLFVLLGSGCVKTINKHVG